MLIVSPVRPPPPNARKRKITPSSEASSVKRIVIAVVTGTGVIKSSQNSIPLSMFPSPLAWPAGATQARIDARFSTLPIPTSQGASGQSQPSLLPRHIILPFDLRTDPDALWEPQNREILTSIFPNTYGIAMDDMFLLFLQTKMPPKPWPKTVAGLVCYFAPKVSMQHHPLPIGTPPYSKKKISLHKDHNGRDIEDWEPLFEIIKNHFQTVEVSITEVVYWGGCFVIVLEHRDIDVSKLLYTVANIICFYFYDDQMGRPLTPQTRRLTDPTPGDPDESTYENLQPGLRVTSNHLLTKPGMFQSTTAGVLVQNQTGTQFMTVASHGFPSKCGTRVNHPLPSSGTPPSSGRHIGELAMEVSHTGIALVKLRDEEKFSNVTFQNDDTPEPIQLKRLANSTDYKRGDSIFLDSPDTGCLEGNFGVTSFQRVPSHDSLEHDWILTNWSYMGQDSASAHLDGMGGTAIWTTDGDVLGFVTYAPKDGVMKDWCASTAADELIKRGFTLVQTAPSREVECERQGRQCTMC